MDGAAVSLSSLDELRRLLELEKLAFFNEKERIDTLDASSQFNQIVDGFKARFVGKQALVQTCLKSLKDLPAPQRKDAGQVINGYKVFFEEGVTQVLNAWDRRLESAVLNRETLDLSLPIPEEAWGAARHPIDKVTESLLGVFRNMGFVVVDGPELDTEFYNFDALNMPADHSAREMQDTFFFNPGWLLRTQTSNVQAHALIERGPPLRIVCPGYVYRNESDLTHVPCFRQLECLVVDKGVHMGHLRHTLDVLFAEVFGRTVKTRFRASYFPFTEPSAEVDVECPQCHGAGCRSCKHTGWLEMGGCGVVNEAVLKNCGLDPQVWSGFAFGFGLDRLAMIKYKISDLRWLFDGDLKLLRQLY